MLYLWLKALHIIAVIAWMAGMLYLPRLFVYHAAAKPGSELSETFKTMERRLLNFIINAGDDRDLAARPVTYLADGKGSGWPPAGCMPSCVLVLAMTGLHGFFAGLVKQIQLPIEIGTVRNSIVLSMRYRQFCLLSLSSLRP